MRINLTHVAAIITGFVLLTCIPAEAQDDLPAGAAYQDTGYPETGATEEKSPMYEHSEGRSFPKIKSQSLPADTTTTVAPATAKSASGKPPAESKQGDALSFNFLYYIIQKFKISDIVDQ